MGIHSIVPLFAAVFYISLFAVIIANRVWQRQHKLLVLYLIAAMLWSLSTFFLRGDFFDDYKLLLFRIVLFTSLWWIVQLYHFSWSFLRQSGRWGPWFGYIALGVFGVLEVLGYIPASVTFDNGVVDPDYGWWFLLYFGPIAIIVLLIVSSLYKRLRILTDPKERNKVAYLIIAIGLLVIFGFTGVTDLADKFPISHLGGLLSAGILTYAVMRHELVSINSVLRQTLGWVSLFIIGTGVYLLLLYLLHLLFGFELRPIILTFATLAAAAVSILVYRIRPIFFGMVNQLFYGGTYSYRQALTSISSKMGNIINLNELADTLLPTISKALSTRRVRLLLEDNTSGDFTTQFAYPDTKSISKNELDLNPDSPVIAWLDKETTPLDLKRIENIPQFKGLWQLEKDQFINLNISILCQIKSRGKLIGILALSNKQSRAHYSQEDIELLINLANQAGIMIENARMFDSLKSQQHLVEQLLAQAVLAQENERERISADLHDSVAQWLIAASYRVQTCSQLLSGNGNDVALDELTNMEDTLNKSVKELRRVVIGLRPPALEELGLTHAVQQCLEELKADGVICRFNEVGTPIRLPLSVEIAVYRVVQETLTNIRKHANATRVNLTLHFHEDRLVVEIRDNGDGFDLQHTLSSAISVGHVGLLGMKQRTEMLGGEMKIKTREGSGTAVTMTFPILSPVNED